MPERRTVLVVSTRLDVAAEAVSLHLQQMGVPVQRLNTESFPLTSTGGLRWPGAPQVTWQSANTEIAFEDVGSVWFRRHRLPQIPASVSPGDAEYCLRESEWFVKGLLMTLRERVSPARWMSDPVWVSRAESKMLQLEVAAQCGLRIPRTLVTNNWNLVRRFFDECRRQVVAKALRLGYFDYGNSQSSVFTTVLSAEHLQDEMAVRLAPVIYQEHLEKAADLRVTIVGERIFAAGIDSQSDPAARTDWRAAQSDLVHARYDLPSNLRSSCLRLMRRLGLVYGALDFVLTPEGQHIFLEVNPSGQWLWLDDSSTWVSHRQSPNGCERLRVNRVAEFLLDCLWPTAHPHTAGQAEIADHQVISIPNIADAEVLKSVLEAVETELKREDDRRGSVDARLQAVGAFAPVAVTLLLAVVTFLTSGRSGSFTVLSVKVMSVVSFYVASQFLRAVIAAVHGLGRRNYQAFTEAALVEHIGSEQEYRLARARAMITWIAEHRRATNAKVTAASSCTSSSH